MYWTIIPDFVKVDYVEGSYRRNSMYPLDYIIKPEYNNIKFLKYRMEATLMANVFTDANFNEEVINSDVPVLVDFYADWCGPCKMIAPIVEQLSGEFEGKAKIGKLDVDANGVTAQNYRVMSIPTLLIFKGGEVVDTIVGAVPKNQIEAKLNAAL